MDIPMEARIPPQARIDLADVMEAADVLVSLDGDTNQLDDGCLLFPYIPSLLQFPTKRGEAEGRRKWERRFRLFWEGEWELLLREGADFAPKSTETTPAIHPTPAHPTYDTTTQRAFITAKRLVELGEFTRAAKKLDSTPVAPATKETYAKLQALHPSRNTPVTKPDINVKPEAFNHLLGYLNLSKQGLRQGEERIPFPKIIRRLLSAKLPQLVTKLLDTANLVALTKGPGKVRPVAVGDAVRRWVTRAVCMQHKNKMAAYFAPLQCAVGTPAGNEKLLKAAETFIQSRREGEKKLLMGLDCTNAFNEVDRQAIVNELASQFPELFHFLWQFYGEPAKLWYRLADGRVRTILSQQGTQQGEPAGPFLFCLALQPVLKAIQASFPRALIQAFMNDITPGADKSKADGVVDKAEEELQTISLKLARKKSKAIDLADVMEAADVLVSLDGDTNQLDDGCLLFPYIPSLLQFPTKRGEAEGRRKWERRFRLFWEGEWELLLREGADFAPKSTETTPAIHPTPAHPTHDTTTQRAFMTAKRLVELEEFTRAAKKLDFTPVAPATKETYAKLQALHPSRNTPVTKPDVNVKPEAFDVPPKMLAKALRSAAKGAASGLSGWRFEHLLGYLNLSKQGLRQGEERIPFPKVIRRLLSAKLPQLVTKLLDTANLVALTKGPGKVRPVAVGDAVR
ncbi:unnamed protein product [Vitrella brassicaformis CCMP3155]|uniref:Reverse transcriptase domain-containing protein n=1 Tax=Vitrella brassicaformis (strain CCMP3155) TaxID=1169540 RepID=A0A0G4GUK7_VITBC|nr:unnamed protein product [Vitrella brassicaformis CCMP3155]|eukprot:CEM34525.1 unnamed protein product [Vitrella brassicaformis CCMP3155]